MDSSRAVRGYVWLSFYGYVAFALFLACNHYFGDVEWNAMLGALLIAMVLASPFIGLYAFYRVLASDYRTWITLVLAAIGLIGDLAIGFYFFAGSL